MFYEMTPDNVFLIYCDANDKKHYQPIKDLNEVGILVDPKTGENIAVVGVEYIPQPHKG